MQLSQTQQLIKSLTLHFLHNKIFNISILQLLCQQQKIHASTTQEEIQAKISVIDRGFQLLRQNLIVKRNDKQSKQFVDDGVTFRTLFNMVNIFVFNVSALNEHYINLMENHMAESTASQSMGESMGEVFLKDKMAIQILRQHLQFFFNTFTQKSQFIQQTITQIQTNQERRVCQSKLGLLQTLDYLCIKYSISNETVDKIVTILQDNEQVISETMSQVLKGQSIRQANKLLFTQSRQLQLLEHLELNCNVNVKNVLSIIDTNYCHQDPPRKIFNLGQISGRQVVEGLIVRILKRIERNQLFTQKKNQDYMPFRILLQHLLNKNFNVYMQFNLIVKRLMKEGPALNSQVSMQTLGQIQRYFRIFVSIQNPSFHQIMQFIYNQLQTRSSQSTSLELMKKLLLNRFLLNLSFYVLYNEPNQNQIKRYVEVANIVRVLFYPKKAEQLAQKMGNPQLRKISDQICYSLKYCLKKQKDSQYIAQNSTFLYINDKILKGQMEQLCQQLKQRNHLDNQGVNIQNMVSDYSLSFSLVKNDQLARKHLTSNPLPQNLSQMKLAAEYNRSNANTRDNQSLRLTYNQKTKKDQTQYNNFKAINRKTQHSYHSTQKQPQIPNQTKLYSMRISTDRQMIEELVEARKQYGQRKRSMKLNYQVRKVRSQKKIFYLSAFSARFNRYKNQSQRDNNLLYIHMTTNV